MGPCLVYIRYLAGHIWFQNVALKKDMSSLPWRRVISWLYSSTASSYPHDALPRRCWPSHVASPPARASVARRAPCEAQPATPQPQCRCRRATWHSTWQSVRAVVASNNVADDDDDDDANVFVRRSHDVTSARRLDRHLDHRTRAEARWELSPRASLFTDALQFVTIILFRIAD